MPRKTTRAALAVLWPALWLVVALQLLGGAAAAPGDGAYIYGVRRNPSTRYIMEINPVLQVSKAVYDTGLDGSTNAVAYDRSRKQVLFVASGNSIASEAGLWAYDIPRAVLRQLTTNWTVLVPAGVTTWPQDAVFYNDAYWYIPDGTAALWKATLNYDGQNVPTSLATLVQYSFNTSTPAPDMYFGDIVIDEPNQMLYGAVIGGGFFKLDLSNLAVPLPFTWIMPLPATPAFTLQLAFSFDLATLYAQDENNNWYTVDKTTGVATTLGWTSSSDLFLDLGGSSLVGVNGTDPTEAPSQQPSASPTQLPSGSPSQAPTTIAPTAAPSQAPSPMPVTSSPTATGATLAPSKAPTTSPTGSPSSSPIAAPTTPSPTPTSATQAPTFELTPFPTFAPPAPDNPWQPVAKNYVCTPEVFLERRRELEGSVQGQQLQIHQDERQLLTWTPEQCFDACRARLNNPSTFVINIYYNATLGEQVCTCCRACEGWHYVPGAQIFAACSVGDGTNSLVRFKSKLKPRKRVAPGRVVRYKATLKSADKTVSVEGLALTVQLPPVGVTYIKSKSSDAYSIDPATPSKKAGKSAHKRAGRGPAAVVNYTSTPVTVTWHDLVLPPRKGMRFVIKVRVNRGEVSRGMPLTFSSSVYQQLPVNGLPYCSSAYSNVTVVVRK